jgi:hypothetical protein
MELQAERTALLSQHHGVSPHKASDERITGFAAGDSTLVLSMRQRLAGRCLGVFFLQADLQPPMAPGHLCFVIGTDRADAVPWSDRGRSDLGALTVSNRDRPVAWLVWCFFANDGRSNAIPICRNGTRFARLDLS